MTIKNTQVEAKPKALEADQSVTTGAGKGAFTTKTVSGIVEGFYKDSSSREIQLTDNGAIKAPPGSGEANTASNLGTGADGAGLYSAKVGVDLRFKRVKAGTNITITEEANDVLISASGGGSGEANTASNLGATGEGVYAQKVGVDLQFKKIKPGTNVTLSSDAESITINAASGGGSTSIPSLVPERYQVIATSGEEAYLTTFDPFGKAGVSWTRSGTTLTVVSMGHGLSNGDTVILRMANIANAQVGAISNVSSDTFDITVSNSGGISGSAALYQRGATLSRSGSTMTIVGPSDISYINGSFRLPSSVSSPLVLDYGDTGLNTSAADRFPPMINQWREDTGAAVIPGTSSASISLSNFSQLSITMPAANRLFRFSF